MRSFTAKLLLACAASLFLAATATTLAQNPGDSVLVIYNKRMPESKRVADYYVQRRQVPASQVFGFDLSTGDNMTRNEFRDSLETPLDKLLEEKNLWHVAPQTQRAISNQPPKMEFQVVTSKIRYAVLCYGVPFRIEPDPTHKEPGLEERRPEMRRNEAAVDNELALLPLLHQHPSLAGPLRNLMYTTTNAAMLHPTNGILMVARLDGPSADIACGLVDKAIEAETNGLWGRAYFDLRGIADPAFKIGDEWLHHAAELCRHLGFETVMDTNASTFPAGFPMSQIALYAGWYDGNVSGPFSQAKVEFMPGAFAYHLHSYSGAALRSRDQHWVGPLLAKGATCTMGSVDEPYLTGTPDIGMFMSRWVYNGFSFGEAAYASQTVLSWQTTVVGDPLYRPFGKNPDLLMDDLMQRHSPWLDWAYLRLINFNLELNKTMAECAAYLEKLPLTTNSAVLTEKLGDLYSAEGKPSSAIHEYELALKLKPSPEQRVRLQLTLAEKLQGQNRDAEAFEVLQALIKTRPDYPGRTDVYRKLLALARKLDRKADTQTYEAELKKLESAGH
jgi:uncharacterized protein (TIGR03790 family)